jgi:RsiW-degrading membrane proteinase PrsW (M82 family)
MHTERLCTSPRDGIHKFLLYLILLDIALVSLFAVRVAELPQTLSWLVSVLLLGYNLMLISAVNRHLVSKGSYVIYPLLASTLVLFGTLFHYFFIR